MLVSGTQVNTRSEYGDGGDGRGGEANYRDVLAEPTNDRVKIPICGATILRYRLQPLHFTLSAYPHPSYTRWRKC